MKNYVLILLMLLSLTGCGYEVLSSESLNGVTKLELSGENTETKKIERFCKKNANKEDSKTICSITNSSGATNEVTIENFKFEEISRRIEDVTTNITFTTNVQSPEDLDYYCSNNYAKDTIFTNCIFTYDGGEYESFASNPELYEEIEYMKFDEGIMTTYNKEADIISDYDLTNPKQVIITPGYIYFHTIDSPQLHEGDEYVVFDSLKQIIIGEFVSEHPINISYSNGKTLLSKMETGEVCELDGATEISCFKIDLSTNEYTYGVSDVWFDGENTFYALVSDRNMTTELHQYDINGKFISNIKQVEYGSGFSRFYEFEKGNPTIFTPRATYPGSVFYASYSVTLNQVLKENKKATDVGMSLYEEPKLNMMDYDVFRINQEPGKGGFNIAIKEGDLKELVLKKMNGDVVSDSYSIKHPFYVNYTTNKYSDFFYHNGGEVAPTNLEYSFNNEEVCINQITRDKEEYTFTCDGEVILSTENSDGTGVDAVIAI